VAHTSEIGLIKVSRFENHKAGVRLEFRCGRRALAQFSQYSRTIQQLGRKLSAAPEGLEAAFERFCTELERTKEMNDLLMAQLQVHQAKTLLSEAEMLGAVRLVVSVQEADAKALKNLATLITQQPETAALLGTATGGKAQILLQRSQDLNALDMKAVFNDVAPMINGKGGGNATAAQGGGDTPEALSACLEHARLLVRKQLMDTQ
jgi:alanyl-tRNA synthetase